MACTYPPSFSKAQRLRVKHDSNHYTWDSNNYIWDDPYLWRINADQILRHRILEDEIDFVLNFFGPKRTSKKALNSDFYWPHLFKDSYEDCKKCDRCQRIRNISARYEMPQMQIAAEENFDL